jgi:hypothetical protein
MRKDAGLTLRALAAKMGRPLTWTHKNELGLRRMDVPEFVEWCRGCGVDAPNVLKKLIARR